MNYFTSLSAYSAQWFSCAQTMKSEFLTVVYLACIIWPKYFCSSYTPSSFLPLSTSRPLLYAVLYVGNPSPSTTYAALSMAFAVEAGGKSVQIQETTCSIHLSGHFSLIKHQKWSMDNHVISSRLSLPISHFLSVPISQPTSHSDA